MNAVEITRAIAILQPNLPVALMTAYADNEIVREGFTEGIIAVIRVKLSHPGGRIKLNKPNSSYLEYKAHCQVKNSVVETSTQIFYAQTPNQHKPI